MNKTIEQRIADIEEQLAQLKQEAKASADEWPKMGDEFYRVDAYGYCDDVWQGGTADMAMLNCGNVFRTEEEAKREVERRKVLTELRKLAKASWNKEPVNYAYYSLRLLSGVIDICAYSYRRNELGVVYFATEKDAEAAIETIGADRLMLLLED